MKHNPRALALVKALGQEEAAIRGSEFMTPLLRGNSARLRIQGLLYQFTVTNARPGWWICHALDARQAEIIAEALPWQRGDYLAIWPPVKLILVEALRNDAWLALPDVLVDGRVGDPVVVQLVENGQPFERVIGRVEGKTLWYDDIDREADPSVAEKLRAALAREASKPKITAVTSQSERAAYQLLYAQTQKARTLREEYEHQQHEQHILRKSERKVRTHLAMGDAELIGITLREDMLCVTWERDQQRGVTVIDTKLNVVSAGICLAGQDAKFDLASVIGVTLDAPWLQHRR